MLLVSSDQQSVHVYKIGPQRSQHDAAQQSWGSYLASFLPARLGDYLVQGMLMDIAHSFAIDASLFQSAVFSTLPHPTWARGITLLSLATTRARRCSW